MGNALIDEQGLNPCNKYAMEQASLRAKWNYYDNTGKDDVSVYVADGTINLTALDPLIYQPRLDSRSLTVAAASILGKHIRDTYMEQLSQYYPEYGWDTNSGYINDHHIEAVKKYGLTIYHRKSYKIRKLFNEQHED